KKLLDRKRPEIVQSLGLFVNLNQKLAVRFEEQEDFPAARKARQEVTALKTELHGADHWEVANARRDLAHTDRLAALDSSQRRRLAEASRLIQKGLDLYKQQKMPEAVAAFDTALHIRQEQLGPADLDTLDSLAALALACSL